MARPGVEASVFGGDAFQQIRRRKKWLFYWSV